MSTIFNHQYTNIGPSFEENLVVVKRDHLTKS